VEERRGPERSARTQVVFRAGNEAIRANAPGADALLIICECGDDECFERIAVTQVEYEGARTSPRSFILAPGHEHAGDDDAVVTDETERFVLVEKVGSSAGVIEGLSSG